MLDQNNNLYIVGFTGSGDFPITSNAFDKTFDNNFNRTRGYSKQGGEAFFSILSENGSDLVYSTFVGGKRFEEGRKVLISHNTTYLMGDTYSTDFPTSDCTTNRTFGQRARMDAFVITFDNHQFSQADNAIVNCNPRSNEDHTDYIDLLLESIFRLSPGFLFAILVSLTRFLTKVRRKVVTSPDLYPVISN